jgi:hypothetical protein
MVPGLTGSWKRAQGDVDTLLQTTSNKGTFKKSGSQKNALYGIALQVHREISGG